MRIDVDISALRRTRWYEYMFRFAAGGAVTVLAALVAKRFGPGIGGLFLAFPAIFPATATLVASHEKKKKKQEGMQGAQRARKLAGADAAGATMGAVALVGFAAATWCMVMNHTTLRTLATATSIWLLIAVLIWLSKGIVRGGHRRKWHHFLVPRQENHLPK